MDLTKSIDLSHNLSLFIDYYFSNMDRLHDKYQLACKLASKTYNIDISNTTRNILRAINNTIFCILNSDNNSLDCQEDYDYLIYLIAEFLCTQLRKNPNFDAIGASKEIMAFFVKKTNAHTRVPFTRNFDDEGNILPNRCRDLNNYITNLYSKYKNLLPIFLDYDLTYKLVVSKEDIEEANRIIEEEQRMKKLAEEEQRMKRLAEKESKKQAEKKSVIKPQPIKKNSINNSPEYNELLKIYNPSTCELKKDVYQKVDLKTFRSILSQFFEKGMLNALEAAYIKQVKDARINRLNRVLEKKDLRKLADMLSNEENVEMIAAFDEYIASDEYDKKVDSEIKTDVLALINDTLVQSDNIVNFIIFPHEDFINEQKENIKNARTHAADDTVIKAADTQLHALQNNSLEQIRSSANASFHELQDSNDSPFIIDKKLKGYRYGHRTAKVCFFTISVHPDNQNFLREKYNWGPNSKLLLVFDISNINIKDEKTIYAEAIKYANDNKNRLLEIYNIFANPFTTKTLDTALAILENGLNGIKEFNNSKTR